MRSASLRDGVTTDGGSEAVPRVIKCHLWLAGEDDDAASVGHLHPAGEDDPAVILDPHRSVGVHVTIFKVGVDHLGQHDETSVAAGDHHIAYEVDFRQG